MKINSEIIYTKAKELRELINEAVNSSTYEDTYLKEKLLKLSRQIPFQIGLSLNVNSIESIRFRLKKAERKLIELQIIVDLSTSEYFIIDSQKLDSLLEEFPELLHTTLKKAEENEEKKIEEFMKEFMV
jgi:hypothetical protein